MASNLFLVAFHDEKIPNTIGNFPLKCVFGFSYGIYRKYRPENSGFGHTLGCWGQCVASSDSLGKVSVCRYTVFNLTEMFDIKSRKKCNKLDFGSDISSGWIDTGQNFQNDCPKALLFKAHLKVKNPKFKRFWS